MTLEQLIARKQVVICAGSGGVGKTTVSAAIGAGMARRGLKVAVLTIDPARRLANSLGLPELANEERQVSLPASASANGQGELWAMMLDAKQTFDELVETYAPDAAAREAILANPIYQELSNAVAGSQEYMAMEKLHELHQDGRYDLLVLDTPPTHSALDFLDAPRRLARFIDSRSFSFFRTGSRLGLGAFGRGTSLLLAVMRRAAGADLLRDMSDFFNSIGDMAGGFRERAEHVRSLLCDSRTTFLLVTSPRSAAIQEATYFHRRLAEEDLPFAGAIVNRMREAVGSAPGSELEAQLAQLLDPDLARRVARNLEQQRILAERDARNVARLREGLGRKPILTVPELPTDVHDIAGLEELNGHLFAAEALR